MAYDCIDGWGDILHALHITADTDDAGELADLALGEIARLRRIEREYRKATRHSADPEGGDDANQS